MMSRSTAFIALVAALVLLLGTFPCCSANNVFCVTPTANTSCSSCPDNSTCATLYEYAQDAELYFTTNTTMIFLPGDHTLNMNITVANIGRLTMCRESSSDYVTRVVCNESVGFSFTSVVDLKIHSLIFTSCGKNFRNYEFKTTLLLESIENAKLVNCSFYDNSGPALTVYDTNITLIENSEFTYGGGGITALDSRLTLTGNTTFIGNDGSAVINVTNCSLSTTGSIHFISNSNKADSEHPAAAIWASTSSLNFTGTSNFINNSINTSAYCAWGGAIHVFNHTSLSFNGTSNFINNSAANGGAISSCNAHLSFSGTSNFINNSADCRGGAILVLGNNTSLNFGGTSNFIGNLVKQYGGAICIAGTYADGYSGAIVGSCVSHNVTLNFSGISNFISNQAISGGGAISVSGENTSLSFTGTSNFISNSVDYWHGGAIYAHTPFNLPITTLYLENIDVSLGTSAFINNSVADGGPIAASYKVSLNFTGTSNFINNSAADGTGGAIAVSHASVRFVGTSNFISNSADGGGGIHAHITSLSFMGTSNFISNSAGSRGGAISVSGENTSLSFTGTSNFISNSVKYWHGGAIYAHTPSNLPITTSYLENNDASLGTSAFINSSVTDGGAITAPYKVSLNFTGNSNFINNSAADGTGGAIAVSHASLSFMGTSNFINNSADGGGGIHAHITSLRFMGTSNFINNSAPDNGGGGVYLHNSMFRIYPNTTLYWENNHAYYGGAIYVDDQSNPLVYCSQIKARKVGCFFELQGQNLSNGIDVQFVFKANSADVAGSVLYGGAIDKCKLTGCDSYSSSDAFNMSFHIEDDNTAPSISSIPFRVCPCEGNQPNCSKSGNYEVHRYPGETFYVPLVTVGQRNGIRPSPVRSRFNDSFESDSPEDFLEGFQYIQETNKTCTKLNYTVFSPSRRNVRLELYADGPCTTFSDKLVLHLHINYTCPPGFTISKSSCVCDERLEEYTTHCSITDGLGQITRDSHDQFWAGYDQLHGLILHPHCPLDYCVSYTVEFPLNNTDLQCSYNRSGLLCGACKKGYSLVLGTSQCKQCTNNHLAFLFLFALIGIALVILLLICKLTVATGALSGILFYANIVGINRTLFLPVETTDALSIFIAWLNLDFGVETCFYNGMDAYSKTWLQFVFPVYIWVIVGVLILVSHFSYKFAKLLGNNPVSVLATLILLSYTKILRTSIAAINVTHLEYPDPKYSKGAGVWLYDANISYLSGNHIPLFIVAMCFLFLFLPYTLLLLFGQWLLAVSHLRLFTWVNKLKPFMDSYHAPYKPIHRYWPGLLLVLRFDLLLILAVNPQQDPSINLLAVLVGSGIITLWGWISGGVYMKRCLNILEGSFTLNLVILVGATYHVKLSGGNQLAVGYTSVIIAFVTFIGILAYHIFQQVRATNLWKTFPKINLNFNHAVINNAEEVEDSNQLREPLLEDPLQPNYGAF